MLILHPKRAKLTLECPLWNSEGALMAIVAYPINRRSEARIVSVKSSNDAVAVYPADFVLFRSKAIFLVHEMTTWNRTRLGLELSIEPALARGAWAIITVRTRSTPEAAVLAGFWDYARNLIIDNSAKLFGDGIPTILNQGAKEVLDHGMRLLGSLLDGAAPPSGPNQPEAVRTQIGATVRRALQDSAHAENESRQSYASWLRKCKDSRAQAYQFFWQIDFETEEVFQLEWRTALGRDEPEKRLGDLASLQKWLKNRLENRPAAPAPPDGEMVKRIELGSTIVREAAERAFGSADARLVGPAFLEFCSGRLAVNPACPNHGGPDSWFVCLFLELALAVRDAGIEREAKVWIELLPYLQKGLHLFYEAFPKRLGIEFNYFDLSPCHMRKFTPPSLDDIAISSEDLSRLEPSARWRMAEAAYVHFLATCGAIRNEA